jgi:hypothetical protein
MQRIELEIQIPENGHEYLFKYDLCKRKYFHYLDFRKLFYKRHK